MYLPNHENPNWPHKFVAEFSTRICQCPEIVDYVIRRREGDHFLEALYLVYGEGWSLSDAGRKVNISSSMMSKKRDRCIQFFVHNPELRMLMEFDNPAMAIHFMRQIWIVEGKGQYPDVDLMQHGLNHKHRIC